LIPFPSARHLMAIQRVALVLILLLPLLVVTVASVPALAILPFTRTGSERVVKLIERLVTWTRALLHGTRVQP
jgi:hypothetical protein